MIPDCSVCRPGAGPGPVLRPRHRGRRAARHRLPPRQAHAPRPPVLPAERPAAPQQRRPGEPFALGSPSPRGAPRPGVVVPSTLRCSPGAQPPVPGGKGSVPPTEGRPTSLPGAEAALGGCAQPWRGGVHSLGGGVCTALWPGSPRRNGRSWWPDL